MRPRGLCVLCSDCLTVLAAHKRLSDCGTSLRHLGDSEGEGEGEGEGAGEGEGGEEEEEEQVRKAPCAARVDEGEGSSGSEATRRRTDCGAGIVEIMDSAAEGS